MSILLTKAYKKVFKELTSEMAFKQKGSLFIRVVNSQIIQTVNLFKGGTPILFTLNIGIFPTCTEVNSILLKEGNFRLEDFLNNRFERWEYEPLDYDNTLSVVLEAAEAFKQNVSPILNEAIDYKSYLNFVDRYELERHGHIIWNDNTRLLTYLKTSNYDKVVKVINAIEIQNKDVAEANKSIFTEDEYNEYLKEINHGLDKLYRIRQAAVEEDTEFINNLLSETENYTKGLLISYGFDFES